MADRIYAVTVDEKEDMFEDYQVPDDDDDEANISYDQNDFAMTSFREELDSLSKSLNGHLDTDDDHRYVYDEQHSNENEENQEERHTDSYYRYDEGHKRPLPEQQYDVANEEDFAMSSFREELDNLTKSLEDGVNLEELFSEAKRVQGTSSKSLENLENLLKLPDIKKLSSSSPFTKKNPKASTTPVRRTPPLPPRVKGTPGPPTPVKTPASYHAIPPASTADVYAVHLQGTQQQEDDDDGASVAELKRRLSSMRLLLDDMGDTLERQDEKIRQLEAENDDLRYQLRTQDYHRRREGQSPNHGHRERYFSPGTKFVGELAQAMDLPEEQYAPLSRIMDKHFARLSEIRNRHGWNDG